MAVKVKINPLTRSGSISSDYLSAFATESIELPADVPVGTSVALIAPDGETLALALVAESASDGAKIAELNTKTQQALAFFANCDVGATKNAYLVVGDTDTLRTFIPVVVRANPFEALASFPPQELPDQIKIHNENEEAHLHIQKLIDQSFENSKGYTDERLESVWKVVGVVDTVENLPDAAVNGNIYFVRADSSEYIWLDEKPGWELLGPTIDLSGYATQAWADGRYPRLSTAAEGVTNPLKGAMRFIHKNAAGEKQPIFRFGSQFTSGANLGDTMREDRWCAELFYDSIRFLTTPGTDPRVLSFVGGSDNSIVRKAELDAAIADIELTAGPQGSAHWGNASYSASFGYVGDESGISISGAYTPGGMNGTFLLVIRGIDPETGENSQVGLDVPTVGYVDALITRINTLETEVRALKG